LLYYFAWILMRIALPVYFKRVAVAGKEKISRGKPVIIISNHCSSFLDAAVMGTFLRRPVYFYVRGDVFTSSMIKWIFRQLKMIPVYSLEHGKERMLQNNDTFSQGKEVLMRKKALLVFPEGESNIRRQVASVKKGTARTALLAQSEAGFDSGLRIVTAGINYSDQLVFRQELWINFGEVVETAGYEALYRDAPNKAILQLTQQLNPGLQQQALIIHQESRAAMAEQLLTILNNEYPESSTRILAHANRFNRAKALFDRINNMEEEKALTLRTASDQYFRRLAAHRLIDASLAVAPPSLLSKIIFKACLPLYWCCFLLNWLPLAIGKRIADRKVTRDDFYAGVLIGCCSFLYWLYWLLLPFCLAITGMPFWWMGWLILPVTGYLALYFYDRYQQIGVFFQDRRRISLLRELRQIRTSLILLSGIRAES
jgi:1-acyl-sn-glycerol-3-phosphate acyltransferase